MSRQELLKEIEHLEHLIARKARKYGPPAPKTIYRTKDRPKTKYTSEDIGEGSDLYRTSPFAEACRRLADVLEEEEEEEEGKEREREGDKKNLRDKVKAALKKIRGERENVTVAQEPVKKSKRPFVVTPTGELRSRTDKEKTVVSWETKTSSREELIESILDAQVEKGIIAEVEKKAQRQVLAAFSDAELNRVKSFLDGIVNEEPVVSVGSGDDALKVNLEDLFMEDLDKGL